MYRPLGVNFVRPFAGYDYPVKRRKKYYPRPHPVSHNIYTFSISHSMTLTDNYFLNSPRFLSVFHNVNLTEFYVPRLATFRANITNSLTITQTVIERLATVRLNVTHALQISQNVRLWFQKYFATIVHQLSVTQNVNRTYTATVSQGISVHQAITKVRYINQSLTTTNTVTNDFNKNLTFEFLTPLDLGTTFDRQIDVERSIVQQEDIDSRFNYSIIVRNNRAVGSGIDIIYDNTTLLESRYSSIILPAPELNDSEKHNDSVTVTRTMGGTFKAFIKRSNTVILSYSWILDYFKASEFREWMKVNMSEEIKLTNWKGEVWLGHIINDNFTLKAEGKYAGAGRQKTSVDFQFEGIKING